MQQTFRNNKNTLFIVSTPIGNLSDITYRAVDILKTVKIVFAEDTRTSKILFDHYNIDTPLESYFEYNKLSKIENVLNYLRAGNDVALISDAGTPGISDPGFELTEKVVEAGFNVSSIPGATASITALTSSGLLIQPHLFIGFLPRKNNQIIELLSHYKDLKTTLIIYESPFRVGNTLKVLYEYLGNRKIVLARELTKIYETFVRTTLKEAVEMDHITKGEYVILVAGNNEEKPKFTIKELYYKYMNDNLDEKEVFRKISKELGISRREVYQEIKLNK